MVALIILIAIGALVLYQVTGALDVMVAENVPAAQEVKDVAASSAFSLVAVVAIVILAALVISLVLRSFGGWTPNYSETSYRGAKTFK